MPREDIPEDEQRKLITEAIRHWVAEPERWDADPDDGGRLRGWLGSAHVFDDDEDQGLYEGDEGEVYACVVGAHQYGNVHVAFYFMGEGMDGGMRCELGTNVELT